MKSKKLLLLITNTGRKYFIIVPAVILAAIFISAALFASSGVNPLAGRNIIIDPGHGGIDPGTNDGESFLEKDINLQIAKKLQVLLQSKNANVNLTRDSDISLDNRNSLSSSRHKRDLLARVSEFNSGKYDIFISIHVNRSSNSRALGPIVLYSASYPSSGVLADCMQESLNRHIKETYDINTSRKPANSDYFIFEYSHIPGIIVETGFISNPREKVFLKEDSYQKNLAESIFNGVQDYFKNMELQNKPHSDEDAPQLAPPSKEDSVPSNIINDVQFVIEHKK